MTLIPRRTLPSSPDPEEEDSSTFDIMLCDYCDAEFYSDEAFNVSKPDFFQKKIIISRKILLDVFALIFKSLWHYIKHIVLVHLYLNSRKIHVFQSTGMRKFCFFKKKPFLK